MRKTFSLSTVKTQKVLVTLLFAVSMVAFVSCKEEDLGPELIGTWQLTRGTVTSYGGGLNGEYGCFNDSLTQDLTPNWGESYTVVFREGGAMSSTQIRVPDTVMKEGSYSVDSENKKLTIVDGESAMTRVWNIDELKEGRMTLTNVGSRYSTEPRVGQEYYELLETRMVFRKK